MKYLGKRSLSSRLHLILNISWYLLLFLCIVLAAGMLVAMIMPDLVATDIAGKTSFHLRADSLEINLEEANISPGQLRPLLLLGILAIVPALAVAIGIVFQLRKIFGSLIGNRPFVLENALRVKAIGKMVLIWVIAQPLVEVAIGIFLMSRIHVPGVDINVMLEPNLSGLFFAFVIFVLAEIFRLGAKLQQDQDLTI